MKNKNLKKMKMKAKMKNKEKRTEEWHNMVLEIDVNYNQ